MPGEGQKVNVSVKRLHLVKREADPVTGEVYKDREPLEILEWTKEEGLKVLFRRNDYADD